MLVGTIDKIKTKLLVLPVFEEEKLNIASEAVVQFLKDNPKFGKLYETQVLYGSTKILLIGVGKKEKFDFEKLQNFAGTATKYALNKFEEITIVPPEYNGEALALGIELATHDPSQTYKSEKEPVKLTKIQILLEKANNDFEKALRKGVIVAESVNLVRRLGDMPANEMTPTYFVGVARKIARENRLKITVIDEKQAKRLGMGAFVGVAQGSEEPSFVIALEYIGNRGKKDKWGIVGKGITFDSGGISIKHAEAMHEMKYDMCGAAAVLGSLQALAKLKVKANVLGVMCVSENLPGGKAQRPGDIVRLYCGKTAEILNTDAEGRLVLVDGLTYVQKKGATKLIDLATLTGACIVALGDWVSGAFTNNDKFAQDVVTAGSAVGEKIWQMPMYGDFDEMIKSDIADMTNVGHGGGMPGAAGAITAAKFLAAVIEKDRPWVHLDIAGTAWDLKPKPYRGPGATGVGVKTLVELINGKQSLP